MREIAISRHEQELRAKRKALESWVREHQRDQAFAIKRQKCNRVAGPLFLLGGAALIVAYFAGAGDQVIFLGAGAVAGVFGLLGTGFGWFTRRLDVGEVETVYLCGQCGLAVDPDQEVCHGCQSTLGIAKSLEQRKLTGPDGSVDLSAVSSPEQSSSAQALVRHDGDSAVDPSAAYINVVQVRVLFCLV